MKKSSKLLIIIAVCAVIAAVLLFVCGCDSTNGESGAEISVNSEVSENVSNTEVSEEVSEEVSSEMSEEVSEEASKSEVSIPEEHTHEYTDAWSSNETDHWKECECGDKSDIASHTYGDWTVTKEAVEETEGSKYHICTVCSYKETVTIPVLSHTHKYGDWKNNATSHWKECSCGDKSELFTHNLDDWNEMSPTCMSTGVLKRFCGTCDYEEFIIIPVVEHAYGDWKNDTTSHWRVCEWCNETERLSHSFCEWKTVWPSACYEEGLKERTCTVCNYSETASIPVIAHTYGDWKYDDDTNHWKECKCGNVVEENHSYTSVVTPPTETERGYTTHTCDDCGYCYVDSYTYPIFTSYSEGLEYVINDDGITCTISGIGTCKDTFLRVPPVIDGYKVTHIGYCAFYSCNSLISVTIADSVTTIGCSAFENCTSLTRVIIPDSVTTIGDYAFSHTKLTSVTIGAGVTMIGNWAFDYCTKLTDVIIGNSVTTIGAGAFSGCNNLTCVTFTDTSGWYVTETKGSSSGTTVDISDTATAAEYLKKMYYNYFWYKK